ncbi:putative lipid II flippase FtsW [Effusibacillus lacus]|uniref:Probable peptidoglycan glycosyltransferase FtsW n=1 Tax=Effusibacillus lacus TaxID=1348429 RepID=A0A292YJ83_9BACL|nr:putative lipid II flippase FtsW [Effusibacillus lacus]TCS74743.1 cell division protein FtsW [Effusibacillus lacus]GAX88555.1 cell division protein FtsW [Effusibacillus lacus]
MNPTRHRPDFVLLIVILLLVSIGLLTIYSASIIWAYQKLGVSPNHFFIRQCIFSIIGLFFLFLTMNMPYWNWRKLLVLMLPGSFFMLLLVFVFEPVKDVHRWIQLGSFSIQPSEVATLTIIIYCAHILTKKKDKLQDFKKGIVPPMVITGLFAFLVLLQPDMDAAALIVVTALAVMFAAGTPLLHLARVVLPATFLAFIFIFTSEWRRQRVLAFLDPFAEENLQDWGFQQAHSLYAIASGGWMGKGLGRSIEKFLYLPEPHTDFIFAIFIEEWGIIGGVFLISLFAILIWRGGRIAARLPDRFGALMAVGITSMIGVAVVINIGVVTGTIPVMGIPLPFITYGGSALVIKMMAMGILLNLSRYTVEDHHVSRR